MDVHPYTRQNAKRVGVIWGMVTIYIYTKNFLFFFKKNFTKKNPAKIAGHLVIKVGFTNHLKAEQKGFPPYYKNHLPQNIRVNVQRRIYGRGIQCELD
jgi:hypothetical protein